MVSHDQAPNREPDITPQSGWVAIAVIAIVLLAATICGNGDYTDELRAERDRLRQRVAQLEMAEPIRDACWHAYRKGDLP